MSKQSADILIVGGGAAGMSAALAASSKSDLRVTIVDDNPRLGGQIWRAELGRAKYPQAAKLIDAIERRKISLVNNAQVFASCDDRCLAAETPSGRVEFEYQKLVLAIGARERFLPFPGWTLPGIFGAGGLQALVKGGLDIKNKRVVVAGTGPLLLAVADYLNTKGAKIEFIAEQTSAAKLRKFARELWRTPSKMVDAAALRARLVGIPYRTDSWITSAEGTTRLERVSLVDRGKTRSLKCDFLAYGCHLVPNTELGSLLGCVIKNSFFAVDELQRTSIENVYCAGEPTGIGGLEASLIEGKIAGLAAAGYEPEARSHFRERDRSKRFTRALERAFALRGELRSLADDGTFVCRCEDVAFGKLREFDNWRIAKLQTRCGMGACQGRVCGPAAEFLFGWNTGAVRPPIFPVRLENL